MKSWLTSKTVIINAIVAIGSIAATIVGVLPTEIAGYVVAGVAALNLGLRFVTKGAVSIALPGNVPAVPPVLQQALNALEQVVAALPPEVGPRALELVTDAADGIGLNGTARFEFVFSSLQKEFPGVGTNVLRGSIEALVALVNQGGTSANPPQPPFTKGGDSSPPFLKGDTGGFEDRPAGPAPDSSRGTQVPLGADGKPFVGV